MARRKKSTVNEQINLDNLPAVAKEELTKLFKQSALEIFGEEDIEEQTYEFIKFNIKPLDAILGGGIPTKSIIAITSPPETGKTTISWQLISKALKQNPYAMALYLDIEGSALTRNEELGIKSRPELLKIDMNRVFYVNKKYYLEDLVNKIKQFIEMKKQWDKKLGINAPVIIIWDSISSTEIKKIEEVSRPEEMTGYQARMLQFTIAKLKKDIDEANILLVLIDQIRANINAGFFGSKMTASSSTETGNFGSYKSSISNTKTHHEIRQWHYLQKGSLIKPQDIPNIDGWFLKFTVVKNKVAPTTNYEIELIFDKRYGISKFWSEFHFLSEYQSYERRLYKDSDKFNKQYASIHPLGIQRVGGFYKLSYQSPIDGQLYEYPKNFRFNQALELYKTDEEFRKLFNIILEHSIKDRIINHISLYGSNTNNNSENNTESNNTNKTEEKE